MRRFAQLCSTLALGIASAGCIAISSDHSAGGLSAARRAGIYERATVEFTNATLFKPVEGELTNSLAFKLAPLIIQEVADENGEAGLRRDCFGRLSNSNGRVTVDKAKPTIYAHQGVLTIHGQPHGQVTYLWWYAAEADAGGSSALLVQGVRITLDSDGFPAIWEVLADSSGAELIFVAQSVEAAAAKEFGAPRSGRHFAVERSVVEQPNVVVARVVDDGPVAMGPIVYLRAAMRDVNTIVCRCMPAQAKNLVGTENYELALLSTALGQWPPIELNGIFSWLAESQDESRLERCLRLPEKF